MTSRSLKKGFTTGAAAAAAAKAALLCLITGEKQEKVEIKFLSDNPKVPREKIFIDICKTEILAENRVECVVIKDAGDDPDVTHKAEIGARVAIKDIKTVVTKPQAAIKDIKNVIIEPQPQAAIIDIKDEQDEFKVRITAGKGVGMVTKPGLEVPRGKPAINSGPVQMIRESLLKVFFDFNIKETKNLDIEIFVPKGEELAKKTLNARLGIIGGISILGTTGIVKPMSHDAYIATIKSGISVAEAMDVKNLVFTTGRRSERFAMDLFPDFKEEAFIQTGDFFKASLDEAVAAKQIDSVIITVFFGKAVKMAMGFPHTHAAKSELTMKTLAKWALTITSDKHLAKIISESNTARHAFDFIHPHYPLLVSHVGEKIKESAVRFSRKQLNIRSVIFDFNGKPVFDSFHKKSFNLKTLTQG